MTVQVLPVVTETTMVTMLQLVRDSQTDLNGWLQKINRTNPMVAHVIRAQTSSVNDPALKQIVLISCMMIYQMLDAQIAADNFTV